jgi:anti-anti-sigma regulatory factor
MTICTSFPDVLFLEEHGHVVISVQSPLSDDQWRMLCARADARASHGCGIILDLNGLDVLDAFSAAMVQKLCTAVRAHGQPAVVSGIPLSISVSMMIRDLRIPDVPSSATSRRPSTTCNATRPTDRRSAAAASRAHSR